MKRETLKDLLKDIDGAETIIDKIMAENGADVEREKGKLATLESEIKSLKETNATYETSIADLKAKVGAESEYKSKFEELEKQLAEQKANEQKALTEKTLTDNILASFGDKKFVNEYTKNALVNEIKAELLKNTGKGVNEVFESLTKDKDGIFANETTPPPIAGVGNTNINLETSGVEKAFMARNPDIKI